MKHVNLEEFAQGKLSVQLNKELKRVTENIQDPNTDPTKERKITVTIKIKPNNERNYGSCAIETKFVPVPELGTITGLTFGKDIRTGEVDMMEVMNQIPGQMSVDDITEDSKEAQEAEEETPKAFDPATGEIYEPSSNVVDLRARAVQ